MLAFIRDYSRATIRVLNTDLNFQFILLLLLLLLLFLLYLHLQVNPGDLIQLGDKLLFMYRNPTFEFHYPDYNLNWTAQLNESLPQSDVTQLHSTPKHILGENTVEKFRIESVSETDFQNMHSTSLYSDDGFCSVGTLSPSEKNSIIFNISNFDNLINAVTKNFDISTEKGKLIPACMLSQGFLHSQRKEDLLALNFFNQASSSLAAAIQVSLGLFISNYRILLELHIRTLVNTFFNVVLTFR